eukprot:3148482-Amphidinium_carterae.2
MTPSVPKTQSFPNQFSPDSVGEALREAHFSHGNGKPPQPPPGHPDDNPGRGDGGRQPRKQKKARRTRPG